ncbi:AAA family ATPase [Longispora sp. K20-0274]|uniref:helix-turn-helix transcriptional regulator n=1 Tax=Longispora sp. K20-0274 TaxID=3088255 RepID=UPI00399998C3
MQLTSPVLIGRSSEIAALEAGIEAARTGSGRAAFLVGEAGVGKSRLAAECAYRAFAAGMPVLRGRCSSTGVRMPLRPITEALLSLFRTGGPPRNPELEPYRPALARLVPDWRDKGAPDEPGALIETAEAVLRLLAVVGADGGCVLVLEDLHDADAETLAVLEYLVDNVAGLRVFLLGALRSAPGPALDLARATGRRRTAVLAELAGLTDEQVRQMAAACLSVPVDELSGPVADRLVRYGDGNPFVVEELLGGMVAANLLRPSTDGWRVFGDLTLDVPTTVVRSVTLRVDGLGPQGAELLHVAAVLGRRFTLSELRTVTGLDDRGLLGHLRAGVNAQLVSPSGPAPDCYEFRHALTVEALLSSIGPAERAAIARRAADALEAAHPGQPGDWCQRLAVLRQSAGDPVAAGLLLVRSGRAALASGAVASAVDLLERAQGLAPEMAPEQRADVLEALLYALAEAGQLDRAQTVLATAPVAGPGALDRVRGAALRARLAWVAVTAGRMADAAIHLAVARQLAGPGPGPQVAAAIDIVAARLTFSGRDGTRGLDRVAEAEELARRAADAAESAGLPVVACQSWQFLALLARRRGIDASDSCVHRLLAVAEEHSLPVWYANGLLWLGINEFLRTAESSHLERARQATLGLGRIALTHTAEATLAMHAVFRADFATARQLADSCADASARLRDVDNHQYAVLARAALAAHQGRRREMDTELAEFRDWQGEQSMLMPLVFGRCRAVCALLEEKRGEAMAELDRGAAWEDQHPNVFHLDGRYGLRPLLGVLAGRVTASEHASLAAEPAAQLRWNRQFVLLARAVLLGTAGDASAAAEAVVEARAEAAPFPTTHHLGLRLVAEAALADGWGEPVAWLRTAEGYFHGAGIPAVAGACRALLRRAGANVGQRRAGIEEVPVAVRRQGITLREYQVLQLLVARPSNQDIAQRLFISPRTVEKHIASLIAKTHRPDRAALSEYAADLSAT